MLTIPLSYTVTQSVLGANSNADFGQSHSQSHCIGTRCLAGGIERWALSFNVSARRPDEAEISRRGPTQLEIGIHLPTPLADIHGS